jgi:hypothetical protein
MIHWPKLVDTHLKLPIDLKPPTKYLVFQFRNELDSEDYFFSSLHVTVVKTFGAPAPLLVGQDKVYGYYF